MVGTGCQNNVPGAADERDSIFVKARWFRADSMDTVPRALLPLLAASTEIPLSDRVGLEESFDTFSSLWFDIMRPRTGRDDDGV